VQTHEMRASWFRIKYDPICDIAVFIDEDQRLLRQYSVATEDTKTQAFTEAHLTGFDFQPIPNRNSYSPHSPRLLATSTVDGIIQLWDVLNPFTCTHTLRHMGTSVIQEISFSPDGYLLAAAGFETVTIWRPESGGEPKAVWTCPDESAWRSRPDEDDESDWVHNLEWDTHGKRLVYTLHDQVSPFILCSGGSSNSFTGRHHSPFHAMMQI
jgi:transducin (beta)-like 1